MTKIDIEENNSSLKEMLEQIRKIMSDDMSNQEDDNKDNKKPKEYNNTHEDDILELSTDEIIDEDENESFQDVSSKKDLLDNIDELFGTNNSLSKDDGNILGNAKQDLDQKDNNLLKNSSQINNDIIKNSEENILTNSNITDLEWLEELKQNQSSNNSKNDKTSTSENNFSNDKNSNIEHKSSLVSEVSAQASAEAIKDLIKVIDKPAGNGLHFRSGTTVEELVIELIKPKLSEWLDENLPNIVKKVVEKEVRKLIPKEDE